jgi:hypothetical protein
MVKTKFKIDIEINYFKVFTMHDDVAVDTKWMLMCHALIGC